MTAGDAAVRVLVVDDSDAARAALTDVVEATNGFALVGTSVSGTEAMGLLPELDPDLVLLDVRMPGLDGHETARQIAEHDPGIAVVLVSADADSTEVAVVLDKRTVSPQVLREVWRARAEAARAAARALREETQALRAEAELQMQRTKRNRRD